MDINEAIRTVAGLGKEAANIDQVLPTKVKCEPDHVYFLADKRGRFERREAEVGPRGYIAYEIDDLTRAVRYFAEQDVVKDGDPNCDPRFTPAFVWCGMGKVQAVFRESADRRDTITLSLVRSDAISRVSSWNQRAITTDQRGILQVLREQLAVSTEPENLVAMLRSIKFNSGGSGHAEIANGQDSLGKSVHAKVLGLDDKVFPEDIVLMLPVYDKLRDDRGNVATFPVRCTFTIHGLEQKFTIAVKAGELERAQRDADQLLFRRVVAGLEKVPGVHVFIGAASD